MVPGVGCKVGDTLQTQYALDSIGICFFYKPFAIFDVAQNFSTCPFETAACICNRASDWLLLNEYNILN